MVLENPRQPRLIDGLLVAESGKIIVDGQELTENVGYS